MFEFNVQPIGINVVAPEDGDIEAGTPAYLQVTIHAGAVIPPPQPGQQPLAVPSGNVNFPLSKEDALATAEKIIEEAEKLPDTPKIITAGNLEGIENLAQDLEKFKSGK